MDLYDVWHEEGRVPPIAGDVKFYLEEARKSGGPVLELACGTGRVSLPIARAGFTVTGVDRSPHMVKLARAKVSGEKATFVRGDMRTFRLGRKFRLVLIPFRSFQSLLTTEDQRKCLRRVREHLAPGGRFIVNIFDPRLEYCVHGRTEVYSRYRSVVNPATGKKVHLRVPWRRNDAVRQIMRERWIYTEGKKTYARDLALRWTYRWEMHHLLELEGFEPVGCYGDFRRGQPKYGAEQIWISRARR